MRLDKRTSVIGAAAVAAAVLLGALAGNLAGPLAGVLAALAGLVSAALWAVASDRRKESRSGAKVLADADRVLAPPRPMLPGSGPSDEQPGPADELPGGVARYLRPEEAVVSFRDRPELAILRDWLVSDRRTDVHLVTGEGGTGKTRLAIQLSEEAAGQYGWRCYWVRPGDEAQAASAAAGSDTPVLLVVDYAETLAGLSGLLTEVIMEGPGPSVRALLLARSAGEWWDQLATGSGTLLGERLTAVSPLVLRALSEPSDQNDVFRQALEAFAVRLEMPCPVAARLPAVGPGAVVLVVHAAALLAVLEDRTGGDPGSVAGDSSDVIARLLLHERKYWDQSQARYGLALGPVVIRRVVAAGTLIGADDETSATKLQAAISDLPDAGVRGRAARWLHDLYPSGEPGAALSEWIAPLRPDLVAENLVVSVLSGQLDLTRALATGLIGNRAGRVLTLLARAALTDPAATGLLDAALAADPANLTVPALAVAIETNPAIGNRIAATLEAASLPPDLLQQIADAIPYPSVALASTAELAYRRLAGASPGKSEERSRNLIALSNRLSELGRREDALAAIEEAVTAYRELARARPDAFLPDLAASLSNQSVFLSGLGRREDALAAIEEAVTIRRELARARPDAFLPDLAMSLNNQSNRLSELGRREDALAAIEEAVTIRRELARARPRVYLTRLRSSLNVMAAALSAMARDGEADAVRAEAASLE